MNKNVATMVVAVALAAALAMSVLAGAAATSAAWADNDDGSGGHSSEGKGEKKKKQQQQQEHNRVAAFIKEIRQESRGDDDGDDSDEEKAGGNSSPILLANAVKISAKGLAVVKGNGGNGGGKVETSDAVLALSGSVFKSDGNGNNRHARAFLTGTLEFGGDRYTVRADGNIRVNDRMDLGQVNISGRMFKETERNDYGFQMKALAIQPSQNGSVWKLVGEQPAHAGRLAKIYAVVGEARLEGTLQTPPATQAAVLTVRSADSASGSELTGMYVNVKDGNSNNSGYYTPAAVSVRTGSTYVVSVSDFSNRVFDRWEDGSTSRSRVVAVSGNVTVTAYYRTLAAQGATLTVNAIAQDDGSVLHMWTTIRRSSDGAKLQSGYTPLNFAGSQGATYTVTVSDYGDRVFDRWGDGGSGGATAAGRTRTVTLDSAGTTAVTAYFRSASGPGPLDRFVVSQIGNQVAGGEFSFTVTALDAGGRVKTDYAGTVAITTNNGPSPAGHANVLPAAYTFTLADAGSHTFKARLFNARSDTTITVSDNAKSATSNAFSVAPAALASVSVSPATATVSVGNSATLTAVARDAYGNQLTGLAFAWSLLNPAAGTLGVMPGTASAVFTPAATPGASSTVNASASAGGLTASGSATVSVS